MNVLIFIYIFVFQGVIHGGIGHAIRPIPWYTRGR